MRKRLQSEMSADRRKRIANRAKNLWRYINEERDQLRDRGKYPFRDWYEEAWEILEPFYGEAINREKDSWEGSSPMDALLYYAEGCMYPPPEIMLAVYRCYEEYLWAGGEMTLEEAFFGPAKPKAGNRAQQYMTHLRYLNWGWKISALEKEGHTRTQAAEILSEQINGIYEPETILRMANKHDAGKQLKRALAKRTKKPPL